MGKKGGGGTDGQQPPDCARIWYASAVQEFVSTGALWVKIRPMSDLGFTTPGYVLQANVQQAQNARTRLHVLVLKFSPS